MTTNSKFGGLIEGSQLNELLSNLLDVVPNLLAAFITDLDGLNIANQSRKEVDENKIGAIMAAIDQTIKRIKTSAEISLGSGIIDTDEFQIVFIKLNSSTPVLFVMVADHYTIIDPFIPYSYLIAEKISFILNNRFTSLSIPFLGSDGTIESPTLEKKNYKKHHIVKLMVLGDEKVGKSSLLNLYINGDYITDYKPTIGLAIYSKDFPLSKTVNLTFHMFDMSGQKNLAKIRKLCFLQFFIQSQLNNNCTNAFFVVFDSTKPETLKNTRYWLDETRKFINHSNVPFILVANKIDLIDNREEIQGMARSILEEYNCQYIETSAITGEGLDEIFTILATKCMD